MTPDMMARWLNDRPGAIERRMATHIARAGELLRTQIMANCAGRPGPNAPTGDYRGSWEVLPVSDLGVTVGTNRPQANRLEYGFYDMTDSLGRHYFQTPYPHVAPAVEQREPQIIQMIEDAIGQGLR